MIPGIVASRLGGPIFATWNPSDKGTDVTLSNGNLDYQYPSYLASNVRANKGKSAGKWYWEIEVLVRVTSAYLCCGVWPLSEPISGYSYPPRNGGVRIPYTDFDVGDVFGVELDMDSGDLNLNINGVFYATSSAPTPGTAYFPMMGDDNAAGLCKYRANFGASTFVYTPPVGYNAGLF